MSIESKARVLLKNGMVTHYSENGFTVVGRGENLYDVYFSPKGASCTCLWSSIHPGLDCSHILACRMILNGDKLQGDAPVGSPDEKI